MKKVMNYLIVLFLLIGNLAFGLMSVSAADAKKDQPLITDLKYDEEKRVISGKTAPHSNVFLKNVAGSVIASETGEFEFPVPENTKVSVITILDAEGDQSTDVRYNFEKKTIESETSKKTETTTTTTTNSSSTEKTENEKKTETSETKTKKTKEKVASSTSSTKKVSGESPTEISEEVYQPKKAEPKRSLIWLWTLLGIIIVIGGAAGGYIGYKKKIEKEEREKSRKKSKRPGKYTRERDKGRSAKDKGKKEGSRRQSTSRSPYKEDPTEKAKRAIDQLEESKYLDYLIDTELSNLQEEKRSRSGRSKVKDSNEIATSRPSDKSKTVQTSGTKTPVKGATSQASKGQVKKEVGVVPEIKGTPSAKKTEGPKTKTTDKDKAKVEPQESKDTKGTKEVKASRREDRRYREEKSKINSRKTRPKRNSKDRNKKRKK